jgi:CIC family chloride channel protein
MIRFLKKMKYPGSWSLFRSDDRLLLMVFAIIVGICSGLAALFLNRSLEAMLDMAASLSGLLVGHLLAGGRCSALFPVSGKNRQRRRRPRRS